MVPAWRPARRNEKPARVAALASCANTTGAAMLNAHALGGR
jgi:hypothetical protein